MFHYALYTEMWIFEHLNIPRGSHVPRLPAVHKQPAGPLNTIPVPAHRFFRACGPGGSSTVHASSEGGPHVPIDCYWQVSQVSGSRVTLQRIGYQVHRWFLASRVVCFGVPPTVTRHPVHLCRSSNCMRLGIQYVTTTAYHPHSNSMVDSNSFFHTVRQ